MEGIISGKTRTYEDFKKQIPVELQQLFSDLRDYCFSLGKNVLEDVRMHRIVFSKSLTFRYFADMEPQRDSVVIKIRRDRKELEKIIQVKPLDNLEDIKKLLVDAYTNIH